MGRSPDRTRFDIVVAKNASRDVLALDDLRRTVLASFCVKRIAIDDDVGALLYEHRLPEEFGMGIRHRDLEGAIATGVCGDDADADIDSRMACGSRLQISLDHAPVWIRINRMPLASSFGVAELLGFMTVLLIHSVGIGGRERFSFSKKPDRRTGFRDAYHPGI